MAERGNPAEPVIDPFENFARLPFYQQENQKFIDSVGIQPGQTVVDLACGPGNISGLIAERVGPHGKILAVDISHRALLAARKNLQNIETPIDFIQTAAENLGLFDSLKGRVDVVICGNAIHNFSDKKAAVSGVSMLLKQDGIFAFNTTFFDEAVSEEQFNFLYRPWTFQAMRIATKKSREKGLSLARKPDEKVEARKDWSVDEYVKLLEEMGFRIRLLATKPVAIPLEGFMAISEDGEFVHGAMSKFPYEIASAALKEAISNLFKEKEWLYSSRNWLRVIAIKSS